MSVQSTNAYTTWVPPTEHGSSCVSFNEAAEQFDACVGRWTEASRSQLGGFCNCLDNLHTSLQKIVQTWYNANCVTEAQARLRDLADVIALCDEEKASSSRMSFSDWMLHYFWVHCEPFASPVLLLTAFRRTDHVEIVVAHAVFAGRAGRLSDRH